MIRLRDLREDNDLTQSQLAEKLNIRQRTLSDYETGKTQADYQTLINIAKFFNVSIDYILGLTANPFVKENCFSDLSKEEFEELFIYAEFLKMKRVPLKQKIS